MMRPPASLNSGHHAPASYLFVEQYAMLWKQVDSGQLGSFKALEKRIKHLWTAPQLDTEDPWGKLGRAMA